MGIPIYISRVSHQAEVARRHARCRLCGQEGEERVERHWVSVRVYGLPVASTEVRHEWQCSACGRSAAGPSPDGAPGLPFMHRFGLFVVIAGIIAAGVLAIAVPIISHRIESARYRELTRAKEEAAALAKQAVARAEAKQKKCFDTVLGAIQAAFPERVMNAKQRVPSDKRPLLGAPFVSVVHASGTGMVIPRGALFGHSACPAPPVSSDVKAYARGLTGTRVDPALVRKEAVELAAAAEQITPPAVVGVVDYSCPKQECAAVAGWVSLADKRALAVARAQKPMRHLGYDKDAQELAPLLAAAVAGW